VWTRGTFADFACLYSQGKARRLPNEGGGTHRPYRLAGRYVAYATFGSAIGDEFDRLYVYDIRAGRVHEFASSNQISAIVLKPNGSVAWIQHSLVAAPGSATSYEVRKISVAERQGAFLLDRDTGIGATSLALSADGSSITWKRDGAAQTAPLG
jgi:hypothetical protein